MLICPHCQFENPNDNKFCQNCGTSLIHKDCPQCSTQVALNTQNCPNCGAECGTIWWAIITQKIPVAISEDGVSNSSLSKLAVGSFLDPQQRYQLLEPLPDFQVMATNVEVKVRVLDCRPYQISPIGAMLEHEPKGLMMSSVDVNGIPSFAQAYIALQKDISAGIPLIHDGWEQDNIQVLFLEDRSHWQLLLDLWQDDTTHPLQILHWCYEMVQLWEVLEPVDCRQSLLELSNLRLDEDQRLGLQRLYVEESAGNLPNTAQPVNIKALGRVWETLCRKSQRTHIGSVVHMLEDLEVGKIETLAQLRSRLEEIATELESPQNPDFSNLEAQYTPAPTMFPDDDHDADAEEINDRNEDAPTILLSMQLKSVEDTGRTDVGRQRNHNEDYFGIQSNLQKVELPRSRTLQARGLYILCDGMGGHAGGEVASELAVKTVQQYFQENWVSPELPTVETIRQAVYLANQKIYDLNQQDSRSGVGRMGTTLVMLLMQNTRAVVAHVGDSRLYRLTRKGGLVQVTVDHEVGQREISKGVEPSIAYARPDAYQLTQALGPRDENLLHPDVEFFEIHEDTLLLLASDGLSDNDLLESNYQTHLEPLLSSGVNLELGLSDLIDLANEYNGHDNITAILIRVKVCPNQQSFQ
ncbi:serine/threonine phosphatase [Anabaena catenula]|uniref:Serine/threonine phosphatase n=1 Tax=Anabaena catenula FACHB-362 TaxID=2692877 RepID=A0ABR8IZM5_9NOST|nr:serine/threonine phosphatase [Anabaena catenula]MBD2691064.1 serine/threonine phosphatase [Anabaena catenula FACHB-362]